MCENYFNNNMGRLPDSPTLHLCLGFSSLKSKACTWILPNPCSLSGGSRVAVHASKQSELKEHVHQQQNDKKQNFFVTLNPAVKLKRGINEHILFFW